MTYVDGFYWTVMTLTTIGYGDMTALSSRGRALEMVLAVGGLGLFAVFTDLTGRWTKLLPLKGHESLQSIIGFVLVLSVGGGIMAYIENLSYADGLYLALATVTSIGYGDLYPQTQMGKIGMCFYAPLSLSVTGVCLSTWGDFVQNRAMGVWHSAHSNFKHAMYDAQTATGHNPLKRFNTFKED